MNTTHPPYLKSVNDKVAIIGLGYVGLPLAIELSKVRKVVGFDIDETRITELRSGTDRTLEISSIDLLAASNLELSSDQNNLKECGIYIVTVPTPIDVANRPDLTLIIMASEMIGKVISFGSIIIYESTTYPGCTEEICVPTIERVSGLKFNKDFFCGYSPERINPGDKSNTIRSIKKITSGSTPEIAEVVDSLYKSIITAGTWKAPSIKVAEAAKVIENCQRDLNIAFVNELAIIFNRLEIDTMEVLDAAATKWNFLPFRPGLVGGHCIGVDPYYLTHKAETIGYNSQVILAGRRINDNMSSYVAQQVIKLMLKNHLDVTKSTVGLMGITFKENCPDIRNSKAVHLYEELKEWGVNVVVTDPWASAEEVLYKYGIRLENISPDSKVDVLVVAVAHKQFRILSIKELKDLFNQKRPILFDVKAIFNTNELDKAGFSFRRL